MIEGIHILLKCSHCGVDNRLYLSSSTRSKPVCGSCKRDLFAKYSIVQGYVYVLSNPKMSGLLKIGHTTRLVEERVAELNSATGVPAPFCIEAYFATATPQEHEAKVYRVLAQYKLKDKEFFEIDLDHVISEIEMITGWPPDFLHFHRTGAEGSDSKPSYEPSSISSSKVEGSDSKPSYRKDEYKRSVH